MQHWVFAGFLFSCVALLSGAFWFGFLVSPPVRTGCTPLQHPERTPVSYTHLDVYKRQSQEPHLFRGTIAENVRYGKLDATDAQVEQALRDARLWDFVESLEEGINTQVGDAGSRLSGGQRQRIAIARALIRGAGLIILDEASSALDTKTEGEIQRTMDEAFRDKTVLVIAHRFTAVAHMDRVYCMENGRVVEQGTVKELLSRDSLLRQMAQTQGGGRNE